MAKNTHKFDSRQQMSKKTFEIFHYKDAKAQSVNIHHHDFYEMYYFLGGDVTYLIEGEKYKLNVGDLVFINPMELHQPIVDSGSVYERFVLWIDRSFLSSLSDKNMDFASCFKEAKNRHVNVFHTSIMKRGDIYSLLENIAREAYSDHVGHEKYSEALLTILLCEVSRIIDAGNQMPTVTQQPNLISRVTDYINNHYAEDLSLDALANRFFVNKYYLSHEFSEQLGIGLNRYITLKRLSIAKELLSNGIPAGEVATKCGFRNYTTFYRLFKLEYDTSPSNF